MSEKTNQREKLLVEGAKRLLARATDDHSLNTYALIPRIKAVVDKYLLRDDENAAAQSISEFIDSLQANDLCLIVACERGDQVAWTHLVEGFSATVRSAARSNSSNEEAAEDLAQSIWAELHGLRLRDDGRPAGKLAYYSGRGSLAGWLRAVVSQLAVDQHRKQSRLVQTEEDTDFDRLAADVNEGKGHFGAAGMVDPEQSIANKFAGAEMKKAIARSIKTLADEDRLLVKLYYFDGLRLREAGAVLGVHEATASRRLTRIHSELRAYVETILIKERGWTRAETERSFAEVALHLEADIEPPLATEGALGEKGTEMRK
jgi:RNA polymerase sigma-70 factor (ECF subfamily)